MTGRGGLGLGILALGAFAAVPLARPRDDVLNFLFLVLLSIALAQSWNVVAGYAGQVNLGHAAFFGLGALATRTLWIAGWPVLVGMALGAVAATAFALLVGAVAFRLRGAYFAIGTLALGEILRITVGNQLPEVSTLPTAVIGAYRLSQRYYLALGLAAVAVAVVALLERSRAGLGMQAIREDEDAAEAVGVGALGLKLGGLPPADLRRALHRDRAAAAGRPRRGRGARAGARLHPPRLTTRSPYPPVAARTAAS